MTATTSTGKGSSTAPTFNQKSEPSTAARTSSASRLWHKVHACADVAQQLTMTLAAVDPNLIIDVRRATSRMRSVGNGLP